ncbi:MAG: hypothetical protein AB7V27_11035 [Candidatus Binatia bacterium]
MAKASAEDSQAAGERRLAEWGVAPEADPQALGPWIGRDALADLAIAARLGAIATETSARVLQDLMSRAGEKRVRREAKRALYRLEQRGVAIPRAAEAAAPAAPLLAPTIEGWASPVDGHGDQLLWLGRPQPGGVVHLFGIANDPAGLREVALHTITRKALRALRAELERKNQVKLVEMDWRHVDFVLHRAFGWAREHGTRMEGDYPALRAQFSRQAPFESEPPGQRDGLEAALVSAPQALTQSAELLSEPEFRTWFRSAEELKPFLDELAAVRDSPLVLNAAQQQERYEQITARAIESVFGGAHRDSWSRRLAEMATYLAASGRRQQSAQAFAVARALAENGAPRDLPFCSQLGRISLTFFFQQAVQDDQERQRSSLVLTPQEALRQRQRERR